MREGAGLHDEMDGGVGSQGGILVDLSLDGSLQGAGQFLAYVVPGSHVSVLFERGFVSTFVHHMSPVAWGAYGVAVQSLGDGWRRRRHIACHHRPRRLGRVIFCCFGLRSGRWSDRRSSHRHHRRSIRRCRRRGAWALGRVTDFVLESAKT